MVSGHKCLRLLCADNYHNQCAFFKSVDRIMRVIETTSATGPRALVGNFIETMMTLFLDNRSLLKQLPDGQIRRIAILLHSQKDSMCLRFLQTLCVSKAKDSMREKPVAVNQKRILDRILKNKDIDLILPWRINKRDTGELVLEVKPSKLHPEPEKWIGLNGLQRLMKDTMNMNERNPNNNPDVDVLMYHTQTIELLSKLCKGRNEEAIDCCRNRKDICSFEQMLQIMFEMEDLPPMLHCAYTKLMGSMYADCAPFTVLPPPSQTRVWAEVKAPLATASNSDNSLLEADSSLLRLKVVRDHLIQSLDTLMGHHIAQDSSWADNYWFNQRVFYELGLLQKLFTLGLFRLDAPIDPLSYCDSGDADTRYDWIACQAVMDKVVIPMLENHVWPDDGNVTPVRMSYIECQSRVCKLVALLDSVVQDSMLLSGLSAVEGSFQEYTGRNLPGDCADTYAKQDVGTGAGSAMPTQICMPSRGCGGDKVAPEDASAAEGVGAIDAKVFKPSMMSERVCCLLLNLALVPHERLQCQVFERVFSIKRTVSDTMSRFSNVHLLVTADAVTSHRRAMKAMGQLQIASRELSMDVTNQSCLDAVKCLNDLIDLVTVSRNDADYVHSFGYTCEHVKSHQLMLLSSDAVDIIHDMLQLDLATTVDANSKDHEGGEIIKDRRMGILFQLCHEFIRRVCWECKPMQALWFKKIKVLLGHTNIRALDAAGTMACIAHDNRSIAVALKAKTLRKFVNLLADHGRKPRWLRMITELIIVDGEPVKSTQQTMTGLLLDEVSSALALGDFHHAGRVPSAVSMAQGNEVAGSRYRLMEQNEFKYQLASELLYHTECIELLVACVKGDSHAPVIRLRGLFSWEDCVSNILDLDLTSRGRSGKLKKQVLYRVKAPFLRLLTEVHLNIQFEKIDAVIDNCGTLFPRWWSHDPDTQIVGAKAPPCLMNEFIEAIDAFTARLKKAEEKAEDADAEVQAPLSQEGSRLRQKFIEACQASTGVLPECMKMSFREGSDPASVLHLIDLNGDGVLSKEEFMSGAKDAGIVMAEQELELVWNHIEAAENCVGVVDLKDVATFLRGGYKKEKVSNQSFDSHKYYVFQAIIPAAFYFMKKYGNSSFDARVSMQAECKKTQTALFAAAVSKMVGCPSLMSQLNASEKENLSKLLEQNEMRDKFSGAGSDLMISTSVSLDGTSTDYTSTNTIPVSLQFQEYWNAYTRAHSYWLAVMRNADPAKYELVDATPKVNDALIVMVSNPDVIDPTTDCPERVWRLVQVIQIVEPFLVVCQLDKCAPMTYQRPKVASQGQLHWIPRTKHHVYNYLCDQEDPWEDTVDHGYVVDLAACANTSDTDLQVFRIDEELDEIISATHDEISLMGLHIFDEYRDSLDNFETSAVPVEHLSAMDNMCIGMLLRQEGLSGPKSFNSYLTVLMELLSTDSAGMPIELQYNAFESLRSTMYCTYMPYRDSVTEQKAALTLAQDPIEFPLTELKIETADHQRLIKSEGYLKDFPLRKSEEIHSKDCQQTMQLMHVESGAHMMIMKQMMDSMEHMESMDDKKVQALLHYMLTIVDCDSSGNKAVQKEIYKRMCINTYDKADVKGKSLNFMQAMSVLLSQGKKDLKAQMKAFKKADRQSNVEAHGKLESVMASPSPLPQMGEKSPLPAHTRRASLGGSPLPAHTRRASLGGLSVGSAKVDPVAEKKERTRIRKKQKKELAKRIQSVLEATEADGHVPEVLRLLECLCTGPLRSEFQNFFREQKGQQHQVDLIAIVFDFVDFTDDYVPRSISYGVDIPLENLHRGLETIEMFVRGPNTANVDHIMSNNVKFLSVMNSVLSNTRYVKDGDGEIHVEIAKHKVIQSTLQLLKTLLESGDTKVVEILTHGINWAMVLTRMTVLYQALGLEDPNRSTPKGLFDAFEVMWDQQLEVLQEDTEEEDGLLDMIGDALGGEDASSVEALDDILLICSKNVYDEEEMILEELRSELIGYYTVVAMLKHTEFQQSVHVRLNTLSLDAPNTLQDKTAGQAWELWAQCKDLHLDASMDTNAMSKYNFKTRSQMANYCVAKVRSVEIQRKGRLETVFFPLTQSGRRFLGDQYRQNEAKDACFNDLEESTENNLQSLMSHFKEETFNIVYEEALFHSGWKICDFLIAYNALIQQAPKYLAFLSNIFLILFYTPVFIENEDESYDAPGSDDDVLWGTFVDDSLWGVNFAWQSKRLGMLHVFLGMIHVFASMFRLVQYLIFRAMPTGYGIWHQRREDEIERAEAAMMHPSGGREQGKVLLFFKCFQKALTTPFYLTLNFMMMPLTVGLEPLLITLQEDNWFKGDGYLIALNYGAESTVAMVHLGYLLASLAGCLWHPVFFALHMLELFNQPTAQLIVTAILMHWDKMMQSLMIMGLITYFYAWIGMLYFYQEHDDYTMTCSTLWQCCMSYLDQGLKSDGIADLLISQAETGFPLHLWTDGKGLALLLWNFSYFLSVVLILGAIMTGIIIDTFGELRDQLNNKETRIKNSCVVCGIARQRFVQCPGASFANHIGGSHNIWSFLCYFLYLKGKKSDLDCDFTPQEDFVYKNFVEERIKFFPMEQTADLRNELDDKEDVMEDQMGRMEAAILSINQQLAQQISSSSNNWFKGDGS